MEPSSETNQIKNYIRQCQSSGMDESAINQQLREAGWSQEQIQTAWAEIRLETMSKSGRKFPLKKLALSAGIIAGALIVIGGGLYAYAEISARFLKPVWNKALTKSQRLETWHGKFEGSYTDSAPEDLETREPEGLFGNLGRKVSFNFNIDGDFRKNGTQDTDFALNSRAGVNFGSFDFGFGAETRKIGNSLYYKIGDNPLASFFGTGSQAEGSRSDWIKIDLAKPFPGGEISPGSFKEIQNKLQELQDPGLQSKFLKLDKFLGSEKINGKPTWRYKGQVDKNELSRVSEEIVKSVGDEKILEEIAGEIPKIFEKIEFRKVEIWIGKLDRQIHQILIEINAPSIVGASLGSAQGKSRDAKRYADMRQIMTALELYFNEHGNYPALLEQVVPRYFGILPEPATPPDGSCSEQENKYFYEQLEKGVNYRISFCLGKNTEGYGPGIVEASSQGLRNVRGAAPNQESTKNLLSEIPFTATLSFKTTLSNLNKPVTIEEPQGALDYFEKFGKTQKNAKQLAGVRQITAVLELYFKDNSRYPDRIGHLAAGEGRTGYLTELPLPLLGNPECEGVNQFFNYRPENNGQSYLFEFCLTEGSGGLGAGKHTVTPSGIDGAPEHLPLPGPL